MCDLTVAFNPLSGNSLSPNRLINNCYSLHGGKTSVVSAAISKLFHNHNNNNNANNNNNDSNNTNNNTGNDDGNNTFHF